MKKMFFMLLISLAMVPCLAGIGQSAPDLALIPEPVIPEPIGPPILIEYDNVLSYCYFADNASWWTGLAILNSAVVNNIIRIRAFDTTGAEVCSGQHTLGGDELLVGTLDTLMETGTIPAKGSLVIEGTESFEVDKFTGNTSTGGFSEMEKSSRQVMLP